MANVTFDAVTKRYGDVTAVEDLTLDVADGEFMVLLGPSGCGKSTALRMIAGLEEISGGELSIGDRVVNQVVPSKRDVAMVFQSYALYPHMTVRKNIESPLVTKPTWVPSPGGGEDTLRKLSSAERTERVAEAARMLDLEPYLDRKPGALSGGQRQRVALARAVVARPAVFLMDEPLSNLDAKLRTQTRAELVDLHRRLGTTFIYVTHDQVEAMTMADRVAIMSDGRLQQVGTPREVYDAPANLFVAGFVGTPALNVATVPVERGAVVVGSTHVPVDAVGSRSTVTVGLRPEHLRVAPDGIVPATVHQVEWLGHEALLRLRIEGLDVSTGWIARVESEGLPQPGDAVRLGVDAAHVHLFDPDTGERIATGVEPSVPGLEGDGSRSLLDKRPS
ncbi:ABC transporter ATP-binding protein [Iamia sp. SCSIO 61187]|uniref:ABC transporter ATP-binding protein n=1 Tax=Iamia sp. SCSIO 61187 TaxID=2722752 RepID=UPI001C639D62|nr:ABC transporter ATP-binding protein [Iamia sp. SCSIO 61187]QYG91593.1 ABC transporter ATP-binding protein [Iamia sp. SCSIO 61187]